LASREKILTQNGESLMTQRRLQERIPESLQSFIGDATLFILDEAQHVPEVGWSLKMLTDTLPKLKIIASGSASFSLAQQGGEPLTGRLKTVYLYPIAARELIDQTNAAAYLATLEERLIFGNYPELFSLESLEAKSEYLRKLVDSFLLSDLLKMENVRGSKVLYDLLTLLAFQIGQEVSLSELGSSLGLHRQTVARYLDLLEKSFVLIKIRGFARNLRKEVTKNSRYYFYDNGVRNALINNFNPLALRNDVGALWENYLVMECLKRQAYERQPANNYFWRTYDQQEVDWVEERQGRLSGYEFKWGEAAPRPPKDWLVAYPNASYEVVNRANFLNFV
jgi:predicted AAA+ superfamily ATPase